MLLNTVHARGVCMHAAARPRRPVVVRALAPAATALRPPAGCGAAAASSSSASAARHATRRHHQGSGIIMARRSRQRAVTALAAAANSHSGRGNDEEPLYLPATASTYAPFSAQLMLAMARQGHLERYRAELAAAYEPGEPVELTRCALLISSISQPQLDHRPYYDALEQMLTAAALLLMRKLGGQGDSSESFGGLDLHSADHVLGAAQAICDVLFEQEGLHNNAADPHAPENGSLAHVMSTGRGNPWSLAVAFLHLADGMGLPCVPVQSATQGLLMRVGQHSSSHSPAVFFISMSQPGVVFAHPAPYSAAAAAADGLQPAASLAASSTGSEGSSSELDAATIDFSRSLNQFLRVHREHHQPHAAPTDADGEVSSLGTQGASSSSDATAVSAEGRHAEFSTGDADEDATAGPDSSRSWQEVDSYAAQDAATRNSWKLLFGPGALEEWGGSVRSSASSGQLVSADPDTGSSSSGWLPESPFAAAAQLPFPDGAGDAGDGSTGSTELLSRTASLDTCCGSSMELDDEGHGSSLERRAAQLPAGVLQLDWSDVGEGGLQPVSKRALLQQLLGGMKLSLMMSGRDEELLMVLRFLRATDPFSLPDLRDMALALAAGQPEEAAPLLREYLAVAPGAADADMVAEVLAQVQLRVQLGRSRGWDTPRSD